MQDALKEFSQIRGFKGAVILGSDGLIIEQHWDDLPEVDFLAANLADLVALANQVSDKRLQKGKFDLLTMEGKDYRLFIKELNPVAFLAVFVEEPARIGLVLLELKEKIRKLQGVI